MTTNNFTNFLALEAVLSQGDLYEQRMQNASNGQILYLGKNITPNALTSDPTWFIKAFTYDSNGFINRVQLPLNGPGFFYVWDNVATYF